MIWVTTAVFKAVNGAQKKVDTSAPWVIAWCPFGTSKLEIPVNMSQPRAAQRMPLIWRDVVLLGAPRLAD
jgi:hypothetical protein